MVVAHSGLSFISRSGECLHIASHSGLAGASMYNTEGVFQKGYKNYEIKMTYIKAKKYGNKKEYTEE